MNKQYMNKCVYKQKYLSTFNQNNVKFHEIHLRMTLFTFKLFILII